MRYLLDTNIFQNNIGNIYYGDTAFKSSNNIYKNFSNFIILFIY